MRDDFDSRFRALEERRGSLVERLDGLEERALVFRPSSDSWSLLQVADHVLRSEEASLEYVRRKLPHVKPSSRPGLRSKWAFPLLRFILALPLRYKMPSAVRKVMAPGEDVTLDDLKDRWTATHAQWRDLLDQLPAELAKAPLFRHPIAGRMDLGGALHFLGIHFDHHLRQIDRLFAHPDFPA